MIVKHFTNSNSVPKIMEHFSSLELDKSWSFIECSRKDTSYITHSYHRYPAKFIPQVARRLIEEFTDIKNIVVDPFMGSGTAIVEALMSERIGIGVDINPVAWLISKAKTTPIEPMKLESEFTSIISDIKTRNVKNIKVPQKERIDYWFPTDVRQILSAILTRINQIEDEDIKIFFLCGFSNILKKCSIWLMKSSKPTRDFKKVIPDPVSTFSRQIKMMLRKNKVFYEAIAQKVRNNLSDYRLIKCQDARNIPIKSNSVSLIVTSPPYVTSYEYADLHQLTALWLEYTSNLAEFRRQFIGTAHYVDKTVILDSQIGEEIIKKLELRDRKKAKEVAVYFSEMRECFLEMHRILKPRGKACIVIGNTFFKGVEVLNAEVFVEQMQNIGFCIYKIIKREIPSKILPQTRDAKTGRFTRATSRNKTLAYPHEYIIIMEEL